jgi:hypothetical protein
MMHSKPKKFRVRSEENGHRQLDRASPRRLVGLPKSNESFAISAAPNITRSPTKMSATSARVSLDSREADSDILTSPG